MFGKHRLQICSLIAPWRKRCYMWSGDFCATHDLLEVTQSQENRLILSNSPLPSPLYFLFALSFMINHSKEIVSSVNLFMFIYFLPNFSKHHNTASERECLMDTVCFHSHTLSPYFFLASISYSVIFQVPVLTLVLN